MGSFPDRLTALQREVLAAFFARESGFFLTGGAALAGFHLGHRTTTDLDLFTVDPGAFERGRHVLASVAHDLGARLDVRQHAPGFERYLITRGDEAVVVDLVADPVPQIHPEKTRIEGIRIDPIEEILVNKLTTVLSRSEERDLVDLLTMERAGYRLEDALPYALLKDGGCTPAALAWVLSQVVIPDTASLPGGIAPAELRSFLEDLIRRLLRAAMPRAPAT